MSNYNVEISADNTITVGLPSTGNGVAGPRGEKGYSAYEVAVKNGYTGTEAEWLATLKGEKGEKGEPGTNGSDGKPGKDGVDGASGTDGKPGANGLSAYELAAKNGFTGNESAWLASLKGEKGDKGPKGDDGQNGVNGVDGKDGLSAYSIAVKNGYNGTEEEWVNKWLRGTIVSADVDDSGVMSMTDINGNVINTNLAPIAKAASSASAAEASAQAAANSANEAANSANEAATSETNAANSARAAETSASDAANSAREQQADWAVTDTTSKAYIKNKPNVVTYKRPATNTASTPGTSQWEDNSIQSIAFAFPDDHPDAYPYGVKVTLGKIKDLEGHTRIYFPHNGGMYLKNCWNSNSNYSGWLTMLNDQNFSKYAVPKSDLASSVSTSSLTVTGETSVPTANAGNSSKAIANTEFVAKSISALVNGAPDQLNTLNELAKALGNDANFSATITAELAKKLNSAEAESTYATKQEAGVPYQIKRNTAYKVGDVLTSPSLPPGCVIVVTQAGTTGSTEPDWTTVKSNMGGVIADGTVTFYINDTLSKHSVGDIVYKPLTKTGEHEYLLPLDGQTIDGVTYKRLVDYLGTNVLPNLNGRYLRADSTPGTMVEAGLPNITGSIGGGSGSGGPAGNGSGIGFLRDSMINGCFQPSAKAYGNETGLGGGTVPSGYPVMTANLDASRSNPIYGKSTTVTPLTYTVRAYICYA